MENKKTKLEWHTTKRKIDDLIPYEHNPRQMTRKQNEDLRKSLERFGLVEIPAIDTDNKIIAGHQRLRVLQLLGRGSEITDVRMPNRKLTEEEFDEYNIRSNKNVGEWDYDLLANFDKDLLVDMGWSDKELNDLFPEEEFEDNPDVAFTEYLNEEHNYIVLYFDNEVDWLQAQSLFNLKKVKAQPTIKSGEEIDSMKRVGIGRVISGRVAINKLLKNEN